MTLPETSSRSWGDEPPSAATAPTIRPLRWVHSIPVVLGVLAVWGPLVAMLAPAVHGGVHDSDKLVTGLTRLTITFCVYSIIAALIDRVTRKWSRWPGVTLFFVISILLCLVFVSSMGSAKRSAQIAAFQKAGEAGMDSLFAMDSKGVADVELHQAVDQATKKLRAMAEGLPNNVTAPLLIEFDTTMSFIEAGRPYRRKIAACHDAGGLGDIHSKDDLERHLSLFREAAAEHASLLTFMRSLQVNVAGRIREAGLSLADPRVEKFVMKVGEGGKVFQQQLLEDEALQAQVRMWEVLTESWGDWRFEDGRVLFVGPRASERLAQFNEAATKSQAAIKKQSELK